MKVYLLLEHCDAWGGVPHDMSDIVLGVFFERKNAEECLWQHARYIYSAERAELILEGNVAVDANKNMYYQIMEKEVQ